MLDKIKTYEPAVRKFILSLQDVSKLGMLGFLVIVLMITWSGIKVIETNYRLQRSISQLEQENTVRELENQNLALENKYFESDEYMELEARKNFGLAAPGETVLVVPKNVALKHTVPLPDEITEEQKAADPKWRQNLNAWMNFLFHRNYPS